MSNAVLRSLKDGVSLLHEHEHVGGGGQPESLDPLGETPSILGETPSVLGETLRPRQLA